MISIILTVIISLSASNWTLCWLIIEINLIIFIPFLCQKKYLRDSAPAVKYFLAQAIGSVILFRFILSVNYWSSHHNITVIRRIMIISLAVKSGTPPFHFWFPQLIEIINWIQIMFVVTLQKIIPIFLIVYRTRPIIILLITVRAWVGALGGINQNSIKKLLAYSSILNTGWILAALIRSVKTATTYFMAYRILSVIMIFFIKKIKFLLVREIISSQFEKSTKLVFSMNLIRLAGMPPFLGFTIKLLVISSTFYSLLVMIRLVIASIVSLLYYSRIVYTFLMSNSLSIKQSTTSAGTKNLLVNIRLIGNTLAPLLLVVV
jgi:NADH-ubiquinone oxidoreductase chain 2